MLERPNRVASLKPPESVGASREPDVLQRELLIQELARRVVVIDRKSRTGYPIVVGWRLGSVTGLTSGPGGAHSRC